MRSATLTTLFKGATALLFSALMMVSISTFGAESLEITANQVRVYEKPDLLSKVQALLPRSMKLVAASQPTGNFKKILYFDHGQKRFGFISLADLRQGTRVAMAPPKGMGIGGKAVNPYYRPRGLHGAWAAGLKIGANYETQGSRTYTDGQGNSANVSSMSGMSSMFEGFLDIPMSNTFTIEAFLQLKNTSGTGTGQPNSSVVGTQALNIILSESFVSIGALARLYAAPLSNFWYGGGFQLDHGNSGTLQLGSNTASTLQGSDLPNFIMLYGAMGYDFQLGGNYVLVDDIRVGAIVNTSPPIIEADIMAGIAYKF